MKIYQPREELRRYVRYYWVQESDEPCVVICLKRYSFVHALRKALFSAYAIVETRSQETRFRAMAFRRINPLLRKFFMCGE